MKTRNLALCGLLSVVTLGIYDIYWLAKLTDETNTLLEDEEESSGLKTLFLTIITFGVYLFFWAYKEGEKIDRIEGISCSVNSTKYLALSMFGAGIATCFLAQNALNHAQTDTTILD